MVLHDSSAPPLMVLEDGDDTDDDNWYVLDEFETLTDALEAFEGDSHNMLAAMPGPAEEQADEAPGISYGDGVSDTIRDSINAAAVEYKSVFDLTDTSPALVEPAKLEFTSTPEPSGLVCGVGQQTLTRSSYQWHTLRASHFY